ncbi:hypothetical protein GGI08_007335 [Coemansia sp. S2]|nr:hypothetical protein GGI08_007335 [Coemansia sp. S2]KAJ2075098.1 hypothetical protein GGH13_000850 [Coemansia sp. S155-1]
MSRFFLISLAFLLAVATALAKTHNTGQHHTTTAIQAIPTTPLAPTTLPVPTPRLSTIAPAPVLTPRTTPGKKRGVPSYNYAPLPYAEPI